MATADRQLFDYFYKIRMNGSKRNGNNTLYLDNHTTITCTYLSNFVSRAVTSRGRKVIFVKVKGARDRRVVIEIQGVIAVALATIHPDLIEVIK